MHQTRAQANRARIVAVATSVGACVAALLVATGSNPAGATTTISPTPEPGSPPVVREASVAITQDFGGLFYYKSANTNTALANASYASQTAGGVALINTVGRACVGNNPAPGGKNNSPRSTISVTGPGGFSATQVSPARNLGSLAAISAGGPPLSPQPVPNNTNYIGDFRTTSPGPHGQTMTLDLTGKPAGIYTVTTTTQHMIRSDINFGGAEPARWAIPTRRMTRWPSLGSPPPEVQTFEYRPWQQSFVDVFGGGNVNLNIVPAEGRWKVNGKSSQIWSGPTYFQNAYTLPAGTNFMLPSDPAACVADLASCLPSTAVALSTRQPAVCRAW